MSRWLMASFHNRGQMQLQNTATFEFINVFSMMDMDQKLGDAPEKTGAPLQLSPPTDPVLVYRRPTINQSTLSRRKWMNIYVGQLPYSTTADELREIFSEYGEIASLNLITDKFTGQSKGFGFVEMPNNAEADKAIKALNKTMLQGREIKVNQAEQRRQKSKFQKRW